jgi:hypothetical protein
MHTVADYLFVASVMLPPVALAIGFLILVSPRAIARAEEAHTMALKAHQGAH